MSYANKEDYMCRDLMIAAILHVNVGDVYSAPVCFNKSAQEEYRMLFSNVMVTDKNGVVIEDHSENLLLNEGDSLVATDPCLMSCGSCNALTVGDDYKIVHIDISEGVLVVVDDNDTDHYYSLSGLSEFFKVK